MSDGGWAKRSKKTAGPSLADWCDANLPTLVGAKIAGLVASREATPRVVGILKAYRARSGVLSNAKRLSLEAEFKGAGQ